MIAFVLLLLLVGVAARINGPCSSGGRSGICLATSSCRGTVVRRTAGCIRDPASITCCISPTCTAQGRSGRCQRTSVCSRAGQLSVPSRSGARGCQREPANVQCCIPRAQPRPSPPVSLPRPVGVPRPAPRPVPAPISGRPCTAHGVRGGCISTAACRARSTPSMHYRSRAGIVTGCERDPAHVQCCVAQSSAGDPRPALPTGLPTSGTLDECQVAAHLRAQGCPEQHVARMVCIAKFESSFRCNAKNLNRNSNGSGDYGLFQANSQYWCSGGQGVNRGNGCGVTCAQLDNCATATKCAVKILRQQGLRAWSVYNAGKCPSSYSLPARCSARAGPPPPPPTPPPPPPARPCNVGSRRGACVAQSACKGDWPAGYCPNLPNNIRCCVPKPAPSPPGPRPVPAPSPPVVSGIGRTPTGSCDIVSPSCSNMQLVGSQFMVDREFMPYVAAYNRCAKQNGVTILVTSSYRDIAHNRRVGGSTRSNHLVGHAIDMNLRSSRGTCNWDCMLSSSARGRHPGVQATINCFNRVPRPSRYGGNPAFGIRVRGRLDAVHLDDGINVYHGSAHTSKVRTCDADKNRSTRVSCDDYESGKPIPPPPPTRCRAHGQAGTCMDYRRCNTRAFSYQANLVTGCRHLPAAVRCCVDRAPTPKPPTRPTPKPAPSAPPRPTPAPRPVPSPPGANNCNVGGVKGKCIKVSQCNGDSPRNFCPNDPADVRCCIPLGRGPKTTPGTAWLSRAGAFAVARRDRSGRSSFPRHARSVNKFVIHTVEGSTGACSIDSATRVLDNKRVWPHFVIGRDCGGTVRIWQYIPMTVGGRALRSPGNHLGTIQVEVNARAANPFTGADAATTEALRSLIQEVRLAFPGIPNRAPYRFDNSRAYGLRGSVRVSESAFRSAAGIVGHQHVPSNTHWDPGAIDVRKLLCTQPYCGARVPATAIEEVVLEDESAERPDLPPLFGGYDIDVDEFKCAFPNAAFGADDDALRRWFVDALNSAMAEFHVAQSYASMVAFLAEVAHETDEFATFQKADAAVCADYDGGCLYTRRGLLGLRGRARYEMMAGALAEPFDENPELVAWPEHAVRVAAAQWKGMALGALAVDGDYREITVQISACRDCAARENAVAQLRARVESCVPQHGADPTLNGGAMLGDGMMAAQPMPEVCMVLNPEDAVNSGKSGVCVMPEECGGDLSPDELDADEGEDPALNELENRPDSALYLPTLFDQFADTLASFDAALLNETDSEEGENGQAVPVGQDDTASWVPPRSLWRYLLLDENETLPLADVAAVGYNAGQWRVGRAPFGYGDDEDRGIDYATSILGYEGNATYRLVFHLEQSDLNALAASDVALRLSVAADDAAEVRLNGALVLAANTLTTREAHYWNDVLELPKESVKVGANIIAVRVYNLGAQTDTFFDLELQPRPAMSAEEKAAMAEETSTECKPGALNCPCLKVDAAGDDEFEGCDDGLECDVHLNECVTSWDDSFNPETLDVNDGALTDEDDKETHVGIAGYCKSPEKVCCVLAAPNPTNGLVGHADEVDENGDPLPDTPLGEDMEPEVTPAGWTKAYFPDSEKVILVPSSAAALRVAIGALAAVAVAALA